MHSSNLKKNVQNLRAEGKTYSEINKLLGTHISKSTIATWCHDIKLPTDYISKLKKINFINFRKMREVFEKNREEKHKIFFRNMELQNQRLFQLYEKSFDAKKLILVILYLTEGSKSKRGSLMFGNSDPLIVKAFVDLMRKCYKIDESKFRCTVQCRADQDIQELESFWFKITGIPLKQFYKARVDKRTIGQESRKKDYKGVCRIDYFSSAVDLELKYIAKVLLANKGL